MSPILLCVLIIILPYHFSLYAQRIVAALPTIRYAIDNGWLLSSMASHN